MKHKLVAVLRSVGKQVEWFRSPDGSEILILPYGGRILGLFAPGNEVNFYWTNAALEDSNKAKVFYESDQWHNSGGDRTWIGPEVNFFFPKFPNLTVYHQQRSLDPGNFQVQTAGDQIQLVNNLTVTDYRNNQNIDLIITKSVSPALNPLRQERGVDPLSHIEYAGYTLRTSLEMISQNADICVGLWNLVQMPHGGDLLVPTYGRTTPQFYFGQVPPEDLIITDHLVRYKMHAAGGYKIGIRAVATTGRVGYMYKVGNQWALIIRNFSVNPSGEYVDVPWENVEYPGDCVQACNADVEQYTFSELEYHVPAIGHNTGYEKCDDAAQVWAYRGSLKDIRLVANRLLSQLI
jgi:hypothetical protein